MRSMVIISFVNGVLAFVGLAIVGHPYAALMGVLTRVMHLVPVLGSLISSFAATLLAVFYGPVLAIWTLVITMVALKRLPITSSAQRLRRAQSRFILP